MVNQTRLVLNQDNYLDEYKLVLWHRLMCWLTGKRIPIKLAKFSTCRSDHADEYRLFFYGMHKFDQPCTRLSFDQKFLDLLTVCSREDLPELMEEASYVFLVKPNNTTSINAKIRRILENNLELEMPDFKSVAFQLNTTTQTPLRRLKDEDTSFQSIKDQVRRDLAIYYLSDNALSINEISLRVGFTEPSTFHRVFKKWTGITPEDYRSDKFNPE
ncbi:MAG: AraC-like DNA-binding protein [Psychrobacter glaciei]